MEIIIPICFIKLMFHRAEDLHTVETDNGNLTVSLSLLYEHMGDYSMTAKYLEQTIDINPDHAPSYYALSRAYFCEYIGMAANTCTHPASIPVHRALHFETSQQLLFEINSKY